MYELLAQNGGHTALLADYLPVAWNVWFQSLVGLVLAATQNNTRV